MPRQREFRLFALAALFVALAALATALTPSVRAGQWSFEFWNLNLESWSLGFGIFLWALCAFGAHRFLRRRLPHHDSYLLPLAYLLSGWGLVLIWRLAPGFGLRQAAWLVIATLALLGVAALPGDLRWLRRYRYTWLLSGLALTALTFLFGVNPSGVGQRLWLGGWGVYLQPAEILKLLLVVFLAAYLSDKSELLQDRAHFLSAFLPLALMWGFSMLILLSQRDLGMSTLFFAVFIIMLYLASGRLRYAGLGAVLIVLAGALGYVLFDVVRIRVQAWWNPWIDSSGRSYQIVQSLIALAAGGVGGRGPGLGAPTLVPVAHSDFIFAALAEEWGLLGVIAAIGLLAVIVFRGLRIAAQAGGSFRTLLASGLSALMAVQALMIMGGVIKLIPLTGVTVPFLSYGGSSLVTQFIIIGLWLKLSTEEPQGSRLKGQGPKANSPILQFSVSLLFGFALIAVVSGYWGFIRRDELLARADNPRRILSEQRLQRGVIYDRNGAALAESTGEPGAYQRRYRYPPLASIIGYVSPFYGLAGVEAAQDSVLHGDAGHSAWDIYWREVLGQPYAGRAVRLTLDLNLQKAADSALGQHTGAVVVVDVHTGEILALASHPTFDPNALDEQWETLIADPRAPLVNRGTLALYQPGGALQPAILAAALQAQLADVSAPFPSATAPVGVGNLVLGCHHPEAKDPLTLGEAFVFGCPWPFAELGGRLGAPSLNQLFTDLRLFEPPALGLPSVASPQTDLGTEAPIAAIGQGSTTITPLHLALITAAIANRGQLPAPQIISATQNAQGVWEPAIPTEHTIAAFAPEAANGVKRLMIDGHSAEALTGEQTLGWYAAFAPATETRCAIVVLLEDGGADEAHMMAHDILTRESACGGIGQMP